MGVCIVGSEFILNLAEIASETDKDIIDEVITRRNKRRF